MTADIVLIVDFTPDNIALFEKCMQGTGYLATIPVPFKEMADINKRNALIKEKNMLAYSFYNSLSGQAVVDILVDVPLAFEELWNKRETRIIADSEIYLTSVKDLIALKEYAGRPQDKSDIILLSRLLKNK